jgi:hypothetical protein
VGVDRATTVTVKKGRSISENILCEAFGKDPEQSQKLFQQFFHHPGSPDNRWREKSGCGQEGAPFLFPFFQERSIRFLIGP